MITTTPWWLCVIGACVGSICWMGNFSGVFLKAASSNALLTTTTFRIVQDRLDYKEGLVKDSNFFVQTRMLAFPFGWVFSSFDISYRCWGSSPSVQHWMFWLFCLNTGVNCWLCASRPKWQLLHTCGAVSPMVHSQCISLTALSFLWAVFKPLIPKSLLRIGCIRVIYTSVIVGRFHGS